MLNKIEKKTYRHRSLRITCYGCCFMRLAGVLSPSACRLSEPLPARTMPRSMPWTEAPTGWSAAVSISVGPDTTRSVEVAAWSWYHAPENQPWASAIFSHPTPQW